MKGAGIVNSAHKVILLALDGWGFELVKKYINEHQLPCLEDIVTHGAFGSLPSVIPYVTLPAWPAMLTGKNPGKLGVYAFLERNPKDYSLQTISVQWDRWNAIWKILGNHGKRSIIFNVPTVSAEFNDFPGIVVSGPIMDKEEGVYAYPPELNAELVRDNYKIYASEYEKVSHEEFYQEITEVTEKKFSYMMRLFEKESWDFFMAGFYYGDVLQHRFWQYMDPASEGFERNSHYSKIITNYMQMIDGYIGTFLERRPENCTMLIVSDHGLGYSKAKLDLN
ncbi:alkaline phosphatase family protein, partial [Patescibacteria group bacterium]|nr:alkaline phosphatase family protein [Patescibacteria group bacterium]